MPSRKDETAINVFYDGHPPNCICAKCSKFRMRLASGELLTDEELECASTLREWIPTNRVCQYCLEPKQMWRKNNNKIGYDNIHCRKYYEYL
jgi:hypothetical protein